MESSWLTHGWSHLLSLDNPGDPVWAPGSGGTWGHELESFPFSIWFKRLMSMGQWLAYVFNFRHFLKLVSAWVTSCLWMDAEKGSSLRSSGSGCTDVARATRSTTSDCVTASSSESITAKASHTPPFMPTRSEWTCKLQHPSWMLLHLRISTRCQLVASSTAAIFFCLVLV